MRDIGHAELGAQTYSGFSRLNGRPSANVIVYLAPGANAVQTADSVLQYMEDVKKTFPAGISYVVPYNSTMFVRAAIKDVLQTLLEAIGPRCDDGGLGEVDVPRLVGRMRAGDQEQQPPAFHPMTVTVSLRLRGPSNSQK